jgi:hypothetical protein
MVIANIKNCIRYYYITVVLIISCLMATITTPAQSWQWGVRGGTLGSSTRDVIIDMCTDKLGNIYCLAEVAAIGACYIGDSSFNTYGGNVDMVVFSYNCNKVFRWAKMIGSSATPDRARAIAIDSLQNIYVTGFGTGGNFTIANNTLIDTVTAANNNKGWFITAFDTSGNFKWFKQPTPDTVLVQNQKYYQFYDIVGTQDGIYGLAQLRNGVLSGSTISITTPGVYLLHYTSAGVLQSALPIDMQINPDATSFSNIRMVRLPSGKIVIGCRVNGTGSPPTNYNLSVGGQAVNNPLLVACFGSNGEFLWKKENSIQSSVGNGCMYRAVYYNHHIFVAGRISGAANSSFGNVNIVNNAGTATVAFVSKLDTLGNIIYVKNSSNSTVAQADGGVAVNSNIASFTGTYTLDFQLNSLKLQNAPNQGYDIFLANFDATTGNIISLDSLDGDFGYNDAANAIISDNKGNIYIGGEMGNQLQVGTQTLQSVGGTSDFFIAKYGTSNCSNSVVPVILKQFTAQKNNLQQVWCSWQSVQESNSSHYILQRSITTTGFSNITTIASKGKPHSYVYTDTLSKALLQSTQTVFYRLAMIDKDGSLQYSNIAAVNLTQQQHLQVYPNPAKDNVTVIFPNANESLQPVQLYSLQGVLVLQTHLNAQTQILNIPVKALPKGTYLLKVKGYATAVVVRE